MRTSDTRDADQFDIDWWLGDGRDEEGQSDLALEALAEIQAMDAEPLAVSFRAAWLGGATLSSAAHAVRWLRTVQGEHAPGSTGYDQLRIVTLYGQRFFGPADSAIGALADCSLHLMRAYHWHEPEALRFLLFGEQPRLRLLRVDVERTAPGPEEVANPAASAFTNEIVLRCRPQATKEQVADAYEAARRLLVRSGGERNRRVTSDRTKHLAVLGYRVHRGDFTSAREAFEVYSAEHADDLVTYTSAKGLVDLKRFRRDLRMAFERVTGVGLVFPLEAQRRESQSTGEEVKQHDNQT